MILSIWNDRTPYHMAHTMLVFLKEWHIDDLIDGVVPESIDGGDFSTVTTRWPMVSPSRNQWSKYNWIEHFLYTSTSITRFDRIAILSNLAN